MTFSVNGIKQAGNEKYTIDILVCVDAPLLVRKILSKTDILILSLKEFSEDKTLFGDIYFTINFKFQEILIVTKYKDIQEACTFFTLLGFNILRIDSYTIPLLDKQIAEIISKSQSNALIKKSEIGKQIKAKEDETKKVYADVDLESAKKVIARVFEKIEIIKNRTKAKVDVQDMKKILSLGEELKKLRMGTNFEKIREIIQEIFSLFERINKEYYVKMQTPDITIFPDSLVTPIDVDRELESLENIQMLKSLDAKISLNNQDYSILGSYAIFWKFFQKDFVSKISDIGGWFFNLFDIAEFILIIITSILGIYVLANEIYLFSAHQYGLVFSLITMGIRGFVVFVVKQFRTTAITRLLLLIVIAIVLQYVLMRVVRTNFAL